MSKIHVEPWTDVVEPPSAVRPGLLTESDFPGLSAGLCRLPQKRDYEATKSESQFKKSEPHDPAKSLSAKWNTVIMQKSENSVSANMTSEKDDDSVCLIDLSPNQPLAKKWQKSVSEPQQSVQNKAPASPIKPLAAKWQGAWGTQDIQAAIARDRSKPRLTPTAAQLEAATRPAPKPPAESIDIDDPSHPYFAASNYFSPDINKYICPKLGCG